VRAAACVRCAPLPRVDAPVRLGAAPDDEEREEVRVLLVDVPADELRKDDAVAEARDGKELGHALEEAEHRPLEVADRHYVARARFGPVLNQANARQASPTRNDAMPCFVWWWLDPA